MNQTLTAIEGIRAGHAQDFEAMTGCTVILCPPNTVGGVDQRGGAPGTRETDLLRPMHMVQHVHGLALAGGSAYGLATADGVMRYLEEQGIGYAVGETLVPIVPAAILFDLDVGSSQRRPDAAMGYAACQQASAAPVPAGSVGAGTGATIGKFMGAGQSSKGGIGGAALDLGGGLKIAALFAVNALGNVMAEDGSILAGVRSPMGDGTFINPLDLLKMGRGAPASDALENTVIGVVATNAKLTKEEANQMAQAAHDGLARAVLPAHTPFDGDTIFALATGAVEADIFTVSAFAAEVTAAAIRNAARAAAP
ncbi:MAG: P1 family peptidase [Anaerolineae bacterium]|nr:P1 family peptidase [Anaerolineae bacterium]